MATCIAVYNSEGCVGRCDANCHDATEPECDCICGGMNHGKGRQAAIANTRAWAERWLDDYFAKKGIDRNKVRAVLGDEVEQHAFDL